MNCNPFSDSATIWYSAAEVAETGSVSKLINEYTGCAGNTHTSNNDYLLIYPNSQFLVACLIPFCRILKLFPGIDLFSESGYYYASVLNCVLILFTELFLYLAAKKAKGSCCALLTLCLCFAFFPYYLNAFKLYSDTMSMPFIALTILFMMCSDSHDSTLLRFYAGLALGIGILLKGSAAVFGVACVIYLMLRHSTLKNTLSHTTVFIIGILVINLSWAAYSHNLSWLDKTDSERYEVPLTHWIMMASSGNGGYNQDDLDYTLSFETLSEKKEATINEYIRRVNSYNDFGYLHFLVKKIIATFGDGIYFQEYHLTVYDEINDLIGPNSPNYLTMRRYCTFFLWIIYSAFLISALWGIRNENGILFLFNICMFGIILFFCIWEAKSRYLLNYTPMFIVNIALLTDTLSSSPLSSSLFRVKNS